MASLNYNSNKKKGKKQNKTKGMYATLALMLRDISGKYFTMFSRQLLIVLLLCRQRRCSVFSELLLPEMTMRVVGLNEKKLWNQDNWLKDTKMLCADERNCREEWLVRHYKKTQHSYVQSWSSEIKKNYRLQIKPFLPTHHSSWPLKTALPSLSSFMIILWALGFFMEPLLTFRLITSGAHSEKYLSVHCFSSSYGQEIRLSVSALTHLWTPKPGWDYNVSPVMCSSAIVRFQEHGQ